MTATRSVGSGPDSPSGTTTIRDTVRDFWRGTPGVRDLGYRLSGSEDLYGNGRRPWASVNFVTAHDGFTLRDLVSYERKHNEANGQDNADGTDNNRSANYGVEGDPADPAIIGVRTRQARNIAATLLLSTGTPMITMGDEMWRTQLGNNNAYCLDSPITWVDWSVLDDPGGRCHRDGRVLPACARGPLAGRRRCTRASSSPDGSRPAATPSPIWCGSRPAASR